MHLWQLKCTFEGLFLTDRINFFFLAIQVYLETSGSRLGEALRCQVSSRSVPHLSYLEGLTVYFLQDETLLFMRVER